VTTGSGTEPSSRRGYRRVPPSPRIWCAKDPLKRRNTTQSRSS